MADELNLQVTTLRDTVTANAPMPQMMYVLLEAQPTGAQIARAQMPLNLVLVLDRSGSMGGARITNLRHAVKILIDQLQPRDFISIVLFDDQVEVPAPSQPAANKMQLSAMVDRIDERGGTQISLGLQSGLGEVQKNLDPSRVNKIVLLTDGNTWGDEAMCQTLAQQAGQMRVPIVALGLGLPQAIAAPGAPQPVGGGADDWNHVLLDDIAQASGGTSDLIETPDQIVRVFQDIVRSAQASVVRNTELLLRLSADVSAKNVWQVTPFTTKLSQRAISPRDAQMTLGDIEKNVGKSVLVELTLPIRAPGKMRIAQAEVSYDVPAAGLMGQKIRRDIVIDFGTESPIKPNVMNMVERVNVRKLQTHALQDAQSGNVVGATQKLRQAATQLLNLGENDLAQQAMQEAQNLQQQGQMSSAGTKRLNYGTRKLTQNLGKPPPTLSAAPVFPPPAPAGGGVTCPSCGQLNTAGTHFCDNCGSLLAASPAPLSPPMPQYAPPVEQPAPAQSLCPRCYNPAHAGARSCARCGEPLPQPSQLDTGIAVGGLPPEPVIFSAHYPVAVQPNLTYTVVAYVFSASATEAVRADARIRTANMGVDVSSTAQPARQPIPIGALVAAELDLPGFRINPARITVRFEDLWHHLDFEIRATTQTALNRYTTGRLTFMMDGVIVADLGLSIYVASQSVPSQVASKWTEPYQAVFCSYSHKDTQIVERVEHVCQALGMKYLRDVTTLRSGELWDERLLQLIEQANIFQLFWSEFAAQSPAVEKEWRHALTLKEKGEAFIRPVYWRQPLASLPQPLQPIHFAYCPELAE